jgi:hypothetical protein
MKIDILSIVKRKPPQRYVITSAIKYGHIGDFVIYGMHGKD